MTEEKFKPKVIYALYTTPFNWDSEYFTDNEVKSFVDGLISSFADIYVQNHKKGIYADFGIVTNDAFFDLVFNNQNFCDSYIEEILKKQGINEVKVSGIFGGGYENLLKEMKINGKTDMDIIYANGYFSCGGFNCLYKFERTLEGKLI